MRQGLVFLIIVAVVFCAPVWAYDWSTNQGTGDPNDPYQISTPEQLMSIGSNIDLLDKHFVLMNDIVFDPNNNSEHVFDDALIAPYGSNSQMPFMGCFDGNGHSVLNLRIYSYSDYLGMFGFIDGSMNIVSVKNLSLVNSVINIGYEVGYVGSLCGKLKDGTVENCYVNSLVVTSDRKEAHGGNIGGLVGKNENGLIKDCSIRCDFHKIHFGATGGLTGQNTGTIENSTVHCTIVNETQYYISGGVGGVAGINSGDISGCVSKGYIEAPYGFGGVVGRNYGNCFRSFFIGTISCNGTATTWGIDCGGFVGDNYGDIKECYAISRIHLKYVASIVGGFVGYADGGAIDQCGSWSNIVCNSRCEPRNIGGFHGRSPGGAGISNCYSQGEIHTDNESIYDLGGFTGSYPEDIKNCYTTVQQIHSQIDPSRDYHIKSFSIDSYHSENQNSFYDIQRSNVVNDYSPGSGIPLNTKRMQEKLSYLEAGWDFDGEDDNGTEDIWKIDSGDYPRLAWLPKVFVPEVLNMSLKDAQETIESAGITVGDVHYHYSDSVPAETVTIQSLNPDQEVTYGREVHLWVSNGQHCPYSGGGEGTEENPCQIENADDLILLGQTPSDYDKSFILTNDINMASSVLKRNPFSEAVIAPDNLQSDAYYYWYLGYQKNAFKGSLNGNNYCISNLSIIAPDGSNHIGLIGRLYSGNVSNLLLDGLHYSCSEEKGSFIEVGGGLAGSCIAAKISGCSVTGTISTGSYSYRLGGLTGLSSYSELNNCHTTVDIEGGDGVGGLVGINTGDILRCSAIGDVTGKGYSSGVGGLVGENSGNISQSYSNGRANGEPTVGGLIGLNTSGNVSSCYSRSIVSGIFNTGCLIGVNGRFFVTEPLCTITHCYATGKIETNHYIRGIIGGAVPNSVNIFNCYWDVDTVGIDEEKYGTGLTTEQMQQQVSFVDWDFEDVWWIDEGNDYPRLRWEINTPPVADAGDDQTVYAWIDGLAEIKLDGTDSYDEDGDVLEYYWFNDANELIATGAEPNVLLPVGEHEITLLVNDGIEDSEPNSCVVTVVDPFEALAGDIGELVSHKGIANSLLAKLDAARKKLEDGNENNDGAAVGSLEALIHAVNAQRGKKISEDNADYLIAVARQIIEML